MNAFSQLDELVEAVGTWSQRNFGDGLQNASGAYMGLVEEMGELEEAGASIAGLAMIMGRLGHAQLKGIQGIRHSPEEIAAMKKDAVADIIIYLADYCHRNDIALGEAVTATSAKVLKRDWLAEPMGPTAELV